MRDSLVFLLFVDFLFHLTFEYYARITSIPDYSQQWAAWNLGNGPPSIYNVKTFLIWCRDPREYPHHERPYSWWCMGSDEGGLCCMTGNPHWGWSSPFLKEKWSIFFRRKKPKCPAVKADPKGAKNVTLMKCRKDFIFPKRHTQCDDRNTPKITVWATEASLNNRFFESNPLQINSIFFNFLQR